jgi:hypothetical protein
MKSPGNVHNKKRLDFVVRYQIDPQTPDGLLLTFLLSYPFGNHKELILQAIRAFWLPLAYQNSGQYSAEEVRELGKKAIALLSSQADYLGLLLGLKDSSNLFFSQDDEGDETSFYSFNDQGF